MTSDTILDLGSPGLRARALAGAVLLLASANTPARAQLTRLATAAGDGSVSVDVDAYGAFGYRTYGGGVGAAGDALYDPVGAVGPSSTTWESALFLRQPAAGRYLTIGSVAQGTPGGLADPGFESSDGTTASSRFTLAGLEWELLQAVSDVFVGPDRVGSLLLQQYVVRNPGPGSVSFDLVRYYEGDLFLGLGAGVPDGGGRLLIGTEELLFQTDQAGEPAATTNLIGITACGGFRPTRGRYEVNAWAAFPNRISAGMALGDIVFGDGLDADEFVDAGADYDVGIALANEFDLAPGDAAVYVTTTVFGTLPPDDLAQGCVLFTRAIAAAGPDLVGCPGELMTLDGSSSVDGDPADGGWVPSWTWDLDVAVDSDGNGLPDDDVDATGETVMAILALGVTEVQLTYTDDDGDVDTDRVLVRVEDLVAPVVDCSAELLVPAVDFDGGPAAPTARALDDCDALPAISNDRTAGGGDATDTYPCGATLVTFTAVDSVGNRGSCATTVRVVPESIEWPIGPALLVGKLADGAPILDWSPAGPLPPNLRSSVLRGSVREPPGAVASGAGALLTTVWEDPNPAGPLLFYDVRSALCDGTLSED